MKTPIIYCYKCGRLGIVNIKFLWPNPEPMKWECSKCKKGITELPKDKFNRPV